MSFHKFYCGFLQLKHTCTNSTAIFYSWKHTCTNSTDDFYSCNILAQNLPPSIQFPPFPSLKSVITTMPKRGVGFTVQEVDVLLSAIESFLPIGPNEWDRVLAEHESHFPEAGRTKESLKRKFTMLYKTRHPTGDPDIPADVLRAKRAYQEITKKRKYQREEIPMMKKWRRNI